MNRAKYEFILPNTILFVCGVPLSGKTTITPLVVSSIEGCSMQSMDIFRILSQYWQKTKPINKRDVFVEYGSCDSYKLLGDGKYSSKNLISGFNKYAQAVCSLLPMVLPKLEIQGVRDIIFEGVQLTPKIVGHYLKQRRQNKLIIIRANQDRLTVNRRKLFGDDPILMERYNIDRILLLQEEIIKQTLRLEPSQYFIAQNDQNYLDTARSITSFLIKSKVIRPVGGRKATLLKN